MIASFLQLRNESENGNLRMCLNNCSKYADEIFIFDDHSTDDSRDVYLEFTKEKNIIFADDLSFKRELFNKQMLLELVLKRKPDWIVWQDGDAIFDRYITSECKHLLSSLDKDGFDGCGVHLLNLWRHPAFYRKDGGYNDLVYCCFWKNNGKLHYDPKEGLHFPQHPKGMEKISRLPDLNGILHYGFASEERIVKKYYMYKSLGQTGWKLDRLLDERSSFELAKVPKMMFPIENIPKDYDEIARPAPLKFDEYRPFSSWDEYTSNSKQPPKPRIVRHPNSPLFSIVMTYWNRRPQLARTLKTIESSKHRDDCEVIIVDDGSSGEDTIENIGELFDLDIKVKHIDENERWWKNPCIPYNMGFDEARGEFIVIQNPETLHFGDVLSHAFANISDSKWLSYGCYAINKAITDRLPTEKQMLNDHRADLKDYIEWATFPLVQTPAYKTDETGWYNHPRVRRTGFHFLAVTSRKNLEELNGFDERYAHGACWDDDEIVRRVKRKGLQLVISDETVPFVIHQWHSSGRKEADFSQLYLNNGVLFYGNTIRETGHVAEYNVIYSRNEP